MPCAMKFKPKCYCAVGSRTGAMAMESLRFGDEHSLHAHHLADKIICRVDQFPSWFVLT